MPFLSIRVRNSRPVGMDLNDGVAVRNGIALSQDTRGSLRFTSVLEMSRGSVSHLHALGIHWKAQTWMIFARIHSRIK